MNRINSKKQKSREEHIEDVLVELEKNLTNFEITIQKKRYDNTRIRKEYQKLFQENKILNDKLNLIQKEKTMKNNKIKDNIKKNRKVKRKKRTNLLTKKVNPRKLLNKKLKN